MGLLSYILPIAGAIIGGFLGSPQIGWALGSLAAAALDPQTINGPRLGDIAKQTSTEGVPRPIVFGTSPPISGNIIADGGPDRVIETKRKNFLSPKIKTEHVYRTYAIRFCEAPEDGSGIAGFLRIWRNDKLVYDVSEDPQLSRDDNDAFLESARFFLGTFTQDASPDLEEIYGVGMTCPHRGTAYMVMAGEEVTDTGGAIPQYTAQIVATGHALQSFGRIAIGGFRPLTDTPVIDSNQVSGLRNAVVFVMVGRKTSEGGTISTLGSAIAVTGITSASLPVVTATGHGLSTGNRIQFVSGFSGWASDYFSPLNKVMTVTVIDADSFSLNGVFTGDHPSGSGAGVVKKVTSYADELPVPQFRDVAADAYADMMEIPAAYSTAFASGGPGYESRVYFKHIPVVKHGYNGAAGNYIGQLNFPAGVDGAYSYAVYRNVDPDVYSDVLTHVIHEASFDPGAFYLGTPPLSAIFAGGPPLTNALSVATWTMNTLSDGYFAKLGLAYDSEGFADSGQSDVSVDNNVADPFYPLPSGDGKKGYRFGIVDAEPHIRYYITSPQTPPFNGALHSLTFRRIVLKPLPDLLLAEPPTVAETAGAICLRSNLPAERFNTSLLADQDMPGIVITNQYTAADSLKTLGRVFLFDASSYDGKVNFVPRGGNSVATITEDQMVDDDSTIQQSKRSDGISIPRVLNLNYFDIDSGGLSSSKQTSTRGGDRRAIGDNSIETAVVMDADLAAKTVDIQHKVMIEDAKGELKFSLPDSSIGLVIADPIIVQWEGRSERAIIVQADTQDGYQEYTCRRDRQSAYTSAVEGIPPPRPSAPPSSATGPTLLEALDIPLLRDVDDVAGLGLALAINGIGAAWDGCLLELSRDGGVTFEEVDTFNGGAIIGELVDALPSHPQEFPDTTNTITVQLKSYGATLTASTLTGMLNRANRALIEDELVNFANVTDLGDGLWSISYFLRGRKGTAPALHAIGARFVVVDPDTLDFLSASIADLTKTFVLRATSLGADVSTATYVSLTFSGQIQVERQVSYLAVVRSGSDLAVSWQGVGRLGGGGAVAQGLNFAGYRVEFDDGSNPIISVDTAAQSLTQDVSGLSSPVTVRVYQLNSLTGEGPAAEVTVV